MSHVLEAGDATAWRAALAQFARVDVCHLPEYHRAYSSRFEGAQALMWCYQEGSDSLCHPFLLSPVVLSSEEGKTITHYRDISSVYGYSGPLATTDNKDFLEAAWNKFDQWAVENNAVSEFIRFSTYADNLKYAHPHTEIEYNRPVALAMLPKTSESYLQQLGAKTRNMIRKADKHGLTAQVVPVKDAIHEFHSLYLETMQRNSAGDFFIYDDTYYETLLSSPEGELLLTTVTLDEKMVAAAMILVHKRMAFYHLGASTLEASRLGAGNLALYEVAKNLIERGVSYFSVGGGRTTTEDDPLFRFKKSNGTSVGEFHIGKRLIQQQAQQEIVQRWQLLNNAKANTGVLQFYR